MESRRTLREGRSTPVFPRLVVLPVGSISGCPGLLPTEMSLVTPTPVGLTGVEWVGHGGLKSPTWSPSVTLGTSRSESMELTQSSSPSTRSPWSLLSPSPLSCLLPSRGDRSPSFVRDVRGLGKLWE